MKRSLKLKNAKFVSVMIKNLMGMMKKNLTEILKIFPGNITTNELQLLAMKKSFHPMEVKRSVYFSQNWDDILS